MVKARPSSSATAIPIVADDGKLDVAGTLDASGEDAGRIELFAEDDVNVQSTAKLDGHVQRRE